MSAEPLGGEDHLRMTRGIRWAAGLASALFLAVTVWSVTVTGALEPSAVHVDHFIAGAGNGLLLLRGALAMAAVLLMTLATFQAKSAASRLSFAGIALLVLPVFLWSCVGLERWAPGYSETAFSALLERHHSGVAISKHEVIATLGPPLASGTYETGETVWSYSYMPSGGFGWNKRIVVIRGDVVGYAYRMDEP